MKEMLEKIADEAAHAAEKTKVINGKKDEESGTEQLGSFVGTYRTAYIPTIEGVMAR